jgi:uncharacterized secreted protein with C-terminal beta-propeller domain
MHLGLGTLLGALLMTAACKDDDSVRTPGDGQTNPALPGDGSDGSDGMVDVETMVPGDGESDFISDVSEQNGNSRATLGAESVASGAAPPQAAADANAGPAAAERAISEADILQLSGDRLYALSRFSGLSVVDVSNPSALRLEGVYRSAAEPFEMYVEDGLVFAMFNGWYSYQCDAQGLCSWQTTSRMQALDARDPSNIRLLADHEVPGYIDDSRRVGDVLYLATHEDGYCWGCQQQANTTVTSFNVADLTELVQVDQLRLPSPQNTFIGSRSISVTNQRIYISGWQWNDQGSQRGSIDVVDISDPYGALVRGTSVPIAGQIQSRWQMDEYDGVLRVISQPGGWGSSIPPVVETFRVNSSDSVQRAGALTIRLPQANEVLQSARFDGTRAYAITAERRDPLFTFDLSDPANPRQLGELEMPGWVYHMEPRGNRIYALGYDPENPAGSLNVSLFDVTNLEQPLLLERVAFGGDWGSFAEDQNRIHKAFSILDDQGLILVPFSGGKYDQATCGYEYGSGIQLVDFTEDTLTRRGVAPQVGSARRALLHRDRLFGIGDNAVQTFDITDRDQPVATAQLDVARNVTTVRVLGDQLMRFGNDWFTQQTILDMTPLAQAGSAEPAAEIDLAALFGNDYYSCGGSASWGGEVFNKGNYAYVPRYSYTYDDQNTGRGYRQQLSFYVVDLAGPGGPQAVGSIDLDPLSGDSYYAGILQTDNTLLVGRSTGYFGWSDGKIVNRPSYSYDVIDLSEPAAPRQATRFSVPAPIAGGGWGYFPMLGCSMDMGWGWYGGGYNSSVALTDGDLVVSQHAEPLNDGSERVRYFLDRIDVSNPNSPRVLPKINIPGTAVHFNAETGELITLDYVKSREPGRDWNDCSVRGAYAYYDEQRRDCEVQRRSLNALVIEGDRATRTSQLSLDQTRRVGNIAVSDTRVFYTTTEFMPAPARAVSYPGEQATPSPMTPVMLETLRLDAGQLVRLPSTQLREMPNYGYYGGQLFAREERVFEITDNRLTVVDTADGLEPVSLTHEIPGWGCGSLEVAADTAYCAVGQRGVEVIDMSSMR